MRAGDADGKRATPSHGVRRIEYFVDPAWFDLFDLPRHLDG